MLDVKLMVELNGFRQKVHIHSDDITKPVLLFLHGGPGVCNRHTIIKDHADLLDTFTVVAWDQRGSGGSYFGVKESDLTVKQLVEDAAALGGVRLMKRKNDMAALALPVTILGGVLYHLLFEAKAQYAYPYMVYMLPLAAAGLCGLENRLKGKKP